MKARLLVGLAAFALFSANASAADIPIKAPAPVAATHNWAGFYAGINAGYGWSQRGVLIEPGPAGFGLGPFTTTPDPKGFIGGAQVGFNLQSGQWVYGVEVDFSGSSIKGDVTDFTPGILLGPPGSFQQVNEKLDWFGTLRARLGYAPMSNLLIYGTGGLAVGHSSYSSLESYFSGATQYPSSGSTTSAGWTIGGGVEWAFSRNWSAKFEYLYYDLGKHTITALEVPGGGFVVNSTFDLSGNIVRAGLNYKFN